MASAINCNPLISVGEMVGDMPCREEFFEAKTAESFEQSISLEPTKIPSQPLADFICLLLSDPYPGPANESFSRITPNDLFLIISGKALPSPTVLAGTYTVFSSRYDCVSFEGKLPYLLAFQCPTPRLYAMEGAMGYSGGKSQSRACHSAWIRKVCNRTMVVCADNYKGGPLWGSDI